MFRVQYPFYTLWLLIHLMSTALWMFLFIVLICTLAGWLCRKSRRRCHGQGHCSCHGHSCGRAQSHGYCHGHPVPPPNHLDALEILRQRYARGEIDDITFQHMRERLGPSTEPERRPPND
jgi:uncharacterized membrane protein